MIGNIKTSAQKWSDLVTFYITPNPLILPSLLNFMKIEGYAQIMDWE